MGWGGGVAGFVRTATILNAALSKRGLLLFVRGIDNSCLTNISKKSGANFAKVFFRKKNNGTRENSTPNNTVISSIFLGYGML